MPKRTPKIAEVTADRKVSASKLKLLVNRLRNNCDSDPIQSATSTPTHQNTDQRLLRSAGENPSNYRVICLCATCNGCHIELFERDYLRAKKDLPLACDHKLNVVDLVLEDRLEPNIFPVTIASISGSHQLAPRPHPSVPSSTGSSVTVDKITRTRDEVEVTYKTVSDAHHELLRLLVLAEEGEVEGYPEYDDESMELYMQQIEVVYTDVLQLAETKVAELEAGDRIREVDSPGVTRGGGPIPGMTPLLDSEERGFQNQNPFNLQPRQIRPSTSAMAGSLERLNQENHNFLGQQGLGGAEQSLHEVATVHSTGVGTIAGSRGATNTVDVVSSTSCSQPVSTTTSQLLLQAPPFVPALSVGAQGTRVQQTTNTVSASQLPLLSTSATAGALGEDSVALSELERKETSFRGDLKELFEEVQRLRIHQTGSALREAEKLAAELEQKLDGLSGYVSRYVFAIPVLETRPVVLQYYQTVMNNLDQQLRSCKGALRSLSRTQLDEVAETRTSRDVVEVARPHSHAKSFLEKTKLPTFSGRVEEYPDFKQQFLELTEHAGYPGAVLMSMLRDKLPKEGKDLIAGVRDEKEAWERLSRRYGDKRTAILTIQRRLYGLNVGAGEPHEKMEILAREVERATSLLSPMNALDALTRDFELVGKLINKLPLSYQECWDDWCTSSEVVSNQDESEWSKFANWLKRRRDIAHNAKLRQLQRDPDKDPKPREGAGPGRGTFSGTCFKCGGKGHAARNCNQQVTREVRGELNALFGDAASAVDQKPQTKGEWVAAVPKAKETIGNCPTCHKPHTYQRKLDFGTLEWPSALLKSCPVFIAMKPAERGRQIEAVGGCPKCTSWKHGQDRCWFRRKPACDVKVAGKACGKPHDQLLHGSGSKYCQAASLIAAACPAESLGCDHEHDGPVLLEVQTLFVGTPEQDSVTSTNVFFDIGATVTLCTHDWAQRAKLRGSPTTLYLRVVGEDYQKVDTTKYSLCLTDCTGNVHHVTAHGMDLITELHEVPDLSPVKHLFPGVGEETFQRPTGPVDLLIGQNFRKLQPTGGVDVGNLRLVDSLFGSGKILTGTDSRLGAGGQKVTPAAQRMAQAVLEMPKTGSIFHIDVKLPSFFEAEDLGCSPAKQCSSCKTCTNCRFRGENLSPMEAEVVRRVETDMFLDKSEQRIKVNYPWKAEAYSQVPNYGQAVAIQASIERRLVKEGLLSAYAEEMDKALEAGSVKKLGSEDLEDYPGPVHYITHFPVLKPTSVSTKIRIVANSALKNCHTGLSFNDCMEPGPNALTLLLDVLLKWRTVEVALMYDLSKAYQSLVTGPMERNLRRFVWRPDSSKPWQIYAYDRVTFGDLIAALALELAKVMVAQSGASIDPLAAKQLTQSSFVDDCCGGGSRAEVKRMKGDKLEDGS